MIYELIACKSWIEINYPNQHQIIWVIVNRILPIYICAFILRIRVNVQTHIVSVDNDRYV